MTTFEKMPSRSMPSATNDPLCPKFKKLKEEEKMSRNGRPLLGSKDAGKRVVGKSKRVANFCAGPAAVSDQVMLNLQHELLSELATRWTTGPFRERAEECGGPRNQG